jgi:hypothetical protein
MGKMAEKKEKSKIQGMSFQIMGVLLIIIGAGIFIFTKDYGIIPAIIAGWIAAVIFGAGMRLYKGGKKYFAVSAKQALGEDRRRPVVYLRSFLDDKVTSRSKQDPVIPVIRSNDFLETEEEALAKVMQEVGPFVAIGRPGEELPELGAERMYVEDDEWQAVISGLLMRSRLVVLRAGKTPGFLWEIQQVAKLANPNKIILLIAMNEEDYLEFCKIANRYLPKPLPKYNRTPPVFEGASYSLSGVICFDRDWSPHFINWNTSPKKRKSSGMGYQNFK